MGTVLVVDDDVDFAFVVAEILRAEGHVVRVAVDARSGAAALDTLRPNVVLCDVQMPFGGGPALVDTLRERGDPAYPTPVILVSAGDDLPRVADALHTPYFLAKPFAIPSLIALVARVFQERPADAVL